MQTFQFRDGLTSDAAWLYKLYQQALKDYIEVTWGWDEEFQKIGFNGNLQPTDWKILIAGDRRIGGFVLKEGGDHLSLAMIIIKPEYQRKGIGRDILSRIQNIAKAKSLPLRLSVMKANPVMPFYLNLGFYQYDEDDACYRLQWNP